MALQEAQIALGFRGGVETKMDHKAVPQARLLVLENAVFTKAVSLVKRNGYEAMPQNILGSSAPYEGARSIAKRGDELVLFTGDNAYSYSAAAARWSDVGAVQSVVVTDEVIAKTNSEQTGADLATLGDLTAVAWEDSRGGVYFALIDSGGRTLIAPRQLSTSGSRPRVVVSGPRLHVYFAEQASGRIRVLVVNPATISAAATATPGILTDDLDHTDPVYDAVSDGTAATITWWASSQVIRIAYVDSSGVIGTPVTGHVVPGFYAPGARVTALGIARAATGEHAIVYATATSVLSLVATGGFSTGAATTLATTAGASNVTVAFLRDQVAGELVFVAYWQEQEGAATSLDYRVCWRTVGAATATLGAVVTQRGCGLASRAFADGAFAYVHTVHDSTYWATYFCQRHDNALVVARLLSGTAGGVTTHPHLPSVYASGRAHFWAGIYNVQLESQSGDQFTESGIRLQRLDFDSDQSHQSAEFGGGLYLGGGLLQVYDGVSFAEAQPHYAPDGDVAPVQASGGGGGMTAGTRNYIIVPETVIATGERLRGPTSIPVEVVTTGGNDQVTLSIEAYRHTAWRPPRAPVSFGVYRTVDGDASAYYRCSSLDPTATGANSYVANDPDADAVAFVDVLSDADLQTREPLYVTGGVLSNDPIPAAAIVAGGKGRLWTSDPSNPNVVRYTQERAEGYTAEPAPDLQILVDQFGGAITGLAVLDDALVIFKERAIYYVAGPGPLANPDLGGGFSAPQLIPSDVGCTNADSIVVTPAGLMFQSVKGIYLLDRSRQVAYIGAPVEAFNAQRVTRTTLIESKTQVRFLTDAGQTLLYDYLFGQWSTFTNHEGVDALVVGGVYHYLRNDGRVFRETEGAYRDDHSHIRLRIETAWIKFRDLLQGWQRTWHASVIGEYKSAHRLLVSWALDYAPQFTAPIEIDAGALNAVRAGYGDGGYGVGPYGATGMESAGYAYDHRIHVGCHGKAIRFRFEDLEATDDFGASFELTELLLTGGVLRGSAVVSPSRMA